MVRWGNPINEEKAEHKGYIIVLSINGRKFLYSIIGTWVSFQTIERDADFIMLFTDKEEGREYLTSRKNQWLNNMRGSIEEPCINIESYWIERVSLESDD